MFPDGERQGLYHTADATLWFFHAVGRYVSITRDDETLRILLPVLRDIIEHHVRGTRFGIGVDPADGLLRQGEEGYQLTWMDAKVDDWVVTPRRGKAVEINALFYNALLPARRVDPCGDMATSAARPLSAQAGRMRESFNRRFWYEAGQHLYDVVDGETGDDPACRPNQLLAISLTHPDSRRTAAGGRCSTAVQRPPVDAVRPPNACARASELPAEVLRRSPSRVTRRTTRARCGHG